MWLAYVLPHLFSFSFPSSFSSLTPPPSPSPRILLPLVRCTALYRESCTTRRRKTRDFRRCWGRKWHSGTKLVYKLYLLSKYKPCNYEWMNERMNEWERSLLTPLHPLLTPTTVPHPSFLLLLLLLQRRRRLPRKALGCQVVKPIRKDTRRRYGGEHKRTQLKYTGRGQGYEVLRVVYVCFYNIINNRINCIIRGTHYTWREEIS